MLVIASSMSLSVGLGFFFSSAAATMILPGLAIAALRNVDRGPGLSFCTGCDEPTDNPSMVTNHIGGLHVAHGNRTGPLGTYQRIRQAVHLAADAGTTGRRASGE